MNDKPYYVTMGKSKARWSRMVSQRRFRRPKLTEEQREQIRHIWSTCDNISTEDLADLFLIHSDTLRRIVNGG